MVCLDHGCKSRWTVVLVEMQGTWVLSGMVPERSVMICLRCAAPCCCILQGMLVLSSLTVSK